MKKRTQKDENPFKYTDTNKRYYTYDYYLKNTFGGKCAKIPIDAGFTCPNIDGKCGVGGCIYCSSRGSGDFAMPSSFSICEQYEQTRRKMAQKWTVERCITYFQAHTNTYAPVEVLREKFEEALALDGVVGLNIATRADCLEDGITELLAELAERTALTVELGLQSANDNTAKVINRGHSFAEFVDGYKKLRAASEKIQICIHIILGLPGENDEMMMDTVKKVSELHPDQVKIHLLHVIRGTKLADMYDSGEYEPLSKEKYVSLVVSALELLPPDTVIARLTGDGMGAELIAPEWSRKKVSVINDVDKMLYEKKTYQGALYEARI